MKHRSDLLELIKKTGVIRRFKEKMPPNDYVNKIIEAGIWGLSVLGIQPWCFVVITKKNIINRISNLTRAKSESFSNSANLILRSTAATIENSPILVAIYNNKRLEKRIVEYNNKKFMKRVWMAEIQAIGGAIQNMFLEANELGLGCVWIDSPAFFEKEINGILKETKELIAFLAIGYPNTKAIRSPRNAIHERVRVIA